MSLTKVYDGKNMVANTFDSRQELIEVILASCFIPVFSGIVPARYRGHRVIGKTKDSKGISKLALIDNSIRRNQKGSSEILLLS